LSDFALRFGLALIVVAAAFAAIIISRRNYAKSADFERSVETLRLEFRGLIDAAQAATIKSIAKTVRDNIYSVVKPIDSTMRDLDDRLARLEQQHAEATAAHTAGTQILDVRLARLEEHADGTAIQNLHARLAKVEERDDADATEHFDGRLAKLEQHADAAATHMAQSQNADGRLVSLEERADAAAAQIAGAQKQSLEENDRIATRLAELAQNLTALGDQLSSVKQTIDGAAAREQETKASTEAINSRITEIQARVDELFPRLALGEKAHKDLGTLIGLFLKRLKKVNADSTEIARRLGALEQHVRSKASQPEGSLRSIPQQMNGPSTSKIEDLVTDAAPKTADGPIEANPVVVAGEEAANEASVEGKARSDESRADQHAT
jgi:chromosome segregation ATPase